VPKPTPVPFISAQGISVDDFVVLERREINIVVSCPRKSRGWL
jgi:hypothetical protein